MSIISPNKKLQFKHQQKQIVYIHKDNLTQLANNPRLDVDRKAIEKLTEQIKKHDFQNPLNVFLEGSNRYTILCGNHRFEACKDFMQEFPCIVYTGSKKDAIARSIADNKSAEWTQFDIPLLKDMFAELDDGEFDMSKTAFDNDEILELFDFEAEKGLTDGDDIPEVLEKPVTKTGDLFLLGEHRLLCGDATKMEDVDMLMDSEKGDMVFTDPPYGVSYADKNKSLNLSCKGNRIQREIVNDHMTVDQTGELFKNSFTMLHKATKNKASYYITGPQGGDLMMMMMMIEKAGWQRKHMIIWAKNNHVLGRMDYHYKHEPIFYGWKQKESHMFYGDRSQFSIWDFDKPTKSEIHPTMKPVELIEKAINNSSKKNEIVIDFFLGSGSTLIASEKTNRKCYGLEIDPHYCDVIIKRWEDFTGKKAVLKK